MNRFLIICFFTPILGVLPLWSQTDNRGAEPPATNEHPEDTMQTPPPVTGANYPTAVAAHERTNYLSYGVVFTSAYNDNVQGGLSSHPISDISYSVAPTIEIDTTTPRLHWMGSYSPGFTLYQRTSGLNKSDQNAIFDLKYRLSPHVSFSARDTLLKSSNVFNQPSFGTGVAISGGAQVPNFSVIAPLADILTNTGSVDLSYQFALNGMIGASGTFTNLHYPNPSQVPGLSDSSSQGASAFYSFRISKMHYIGVTYQYQHLLSYPATGLSETQTHAVLLYYTLYPTTHFTMSFFGGPQHFDTVQPPIPPLNLQLPETSDWTPAAGGSLSWQGRLTNLGGSYSHVVAGSGGLFNAVHLDSATSSFKQQITKTLTGLVAGMYTQSKVLGSPQLTGFNGHSVSGTVSLNQSLLRQHLNVELGYTRMHQSYDGIPVLAANPDTNREFISISCQFSRPLGR